MKKLLFGLILTSLAFSCKSDSEKRRDQRKEDLSNLIEDLSCKSVDDCLSIYDFVSARKIANLLNDDAIGGVRAENMQKIIIEEALYWARDNDFNRSFNTISEGKNHFTEYNDYRPGLYYGAQFTIISFIVDRLIDEEKYKTAKKWALKLPDAVYDSYYQLIYEKGEDGYDEEKTMVKILFDRIDKTEKLLN
ncbi:MAG: hypothetical protein O2906_05550 [Bacteroidetes bacterium]|nr:hypothetical protein [Bacteroidota bacterium]MDA0860421.1 hypothetical protein [Bacteroidota bacterium]MDA1318633.1 hypothetical protein [Bacteroidota bacterium]